MTYTTTDGKVIITQQKGNNTGDVDCVVLEIKKELKDVK